MRIVLANRGDAPVEVELGGEPIAFDLVVTRNGVEVWRRLEGVAVRDILQTLTLAPGEEIEFLDSWPQRNSAGRAVDPGTYRVQGILPVIDPPGGWGTDIHTLTILPR